MLVHAQTFTLVALDFLPVSHTHEVIDQVFAVILDWLRCTDKDVSTFTKLQVEVSSMLGAHHTKELAGPWDFVSSHNDIVARTMRGHSKPFSYKFYVSSDNDVHMAFQTNAQSDSEWHEGPVILQNPVTASECGVHLLLEYHETKMMSVPEAGGDLVDKFSKSLVRMTNVTCTIDDVVYLMLSVASKAD